MKGQPVQKRESVKLVQVERDQPVEVRQTGGINPYDRFAGHKLRAEWLHNDDYGKLRNSAWLLRNSRVGKMINPAAMALVVCEGERLLATGHKVADVLEAFAELLIHP